LPRSPNRRSLRRPERTCWALESDRRERRILWQQARFPELPPPYAHFLPHRGTQNAQFHAQPFFRLFSPSRPGGWRGRRPPAPALAVRLVWGTDRGRIKLNRTGSGTFRRISAIATCVATLWGWQSLTDPAMAACSSAPLAGEVGWRSPPTASPSRPLLSGRES